MNKKLKHILIIVVAHYLFFPFYLGFVSNVIQQLLIFGSLAVYAFLNYNQLVPLFKSLGTYKNAFIIAMTAYATIIIVTFMVPLLYQTNDFSYFYQHIRYIIYLFSYIVLLAMIRTHMPSENTKDKTLELFTLATRNYVIFTIVLITIPRLKVIWLTLINETPTRLALLENSSYFARVGWAGYSGFSVTFMCTLSVLFSIYLVIKSLQNNSRIQYKYIISMLLALIGNAFYGRSGLLTSLVLIAIGITYLVLVNKKFHYALYLSIGIITVFTFLSILQQYNSTLASWYNWMMQPIVSLITTGSIETSSTDVLWTMWFIPDAPTLLMGNGFYSSPLSDGYYMGTDVGFIRPILFSGIVFLLLTYLVPVILTFMIGKTERINRLYTLMMIITLFIFEVKAEVVITLIPLTILIYLAEFSDSSIYTSQNEKFKAINSIERFN